MWLVRGNGPYYGWVLVAMLGVTQTITWGLFYLVPEPASSTEPTPAATRATP